MRISENYREFANSNYSNESNLPYGKGRLPWGFINTMIMYKIKNLKNKYEFDLKRTEAIIKLKKIVLKLIFDFSNNAKRDENVNENCLNLESLYCNSR